MADELTEEQKAAAAEALKKGEGNGTETPPAEPPKEPTPSPAAPEKGPLEESKEVLVALEKQNKIMAENLKKAEKIAAEMMLGGRAPAGAEPTEEEKDVAEAKEFLKGTGFEDTLFPEEKK